jgi:hypothetical protein
MLVGQLAAQEQEPFEDRLSGERRRKGMITKLSLVTILVRDQEEALRWFTEILGLKKLQDAPYGKGAMAGCDTSRSE